MASEIAAIPEVIEAAVTVDNHVCRYIVFSRLDNCSSQKTLDNMLLAGPGPYEFSLSANVFFESTPDAALRKTVGDDLAKAVSVNGTKKRAIDMDPLQPYFILALRGPAEFWADMVEAELAGIAPSSNLLIGPRNCECRVATISMEAYALALGPDAVMPAWETLEHYRRGLRVKQLGQQQAEARRKMADAQVAKANADAELLECERRVARLARQQAVIHSCASLDRSD